jgi:hypothetical protein
MLLSRKRQQPVVGVQEAPIEPQIGLPQSKSTVPKTIGGLLCRACQFLCFAVVAVVLVLIIMLIMAQIRQYAEVSRALKFALQENIVESLPLATIPLLIPICDRPQYLSQVLQALSSAYNVDDVRSSVFALEISNCVHFAARSCVFK